jgi:hypothetical protein
MASAAFATVITRDHLAHARVLAERLRRFHDEPLYVLCIDDMSMHVDVAGLPFRLLTLDDVLPADRRNMVFFYSAFELCNALRPWLHRWLLEVTAHDRWVYLDADIMPWGPLDEAWKELDFASVLLTPHALSPPPPEHVELERINLRFGVYNSGFLGVRRCAEAARFIDWFADRLSTLCFSDWQDVFVDQLWLNFAPGYFADAKEWRHPGANIANWNYYERSIGRVGDGYTANGRPLLFTHMSSWAYETPETWAYGRPVAAEADRDILAEIGATYRDALAAAGHEVCRTWTYGFATFTDGHPITRPMRRGWYARCTGGTAPEGSPFDHPEWFRGPRYVDWRRCVPLPVKRLLRRMTNSA